MVSYGCMPGGLSPLFGSGSEALINVVGCLFCFCLQIYASKCLHSSIYNMGSKSRRRSVQLQGCDLVGIMEMWRDSSHD